MLSWRRREEGETRLRAPVLPDLRAGGGFTIILWLDLDTINLQTPQHILDGMSRVSGSLGDFLISLINFKISTQMRKMLRIL